MKATSFASRKGNPIATSVVLFLYATNVVLNDRVIENNQDKGSQDCARTAILQGIQPIADKRTFSSASG